MKRLLGTFMLAAAVTFGSSSEAQAQFTFGPGVAFHDDADLGIGAWFSTPMESIHEQVSLWGSFIYFFPDGGRDFGAISTDFNYLEFNAGLAYAFPLADSPIVPFASAGLNLARTSFDYDGPGNEFFDGGSNTDLGLNLGGGIRTNLGDSLTGIAGARIELGGGEGFVIEAGLGFPMGG